MTKKVFLGGTVNGSIWREKLIPLLKIDYFDPVIKDREWTLVDQEKEMAEKKDCDFILYTITKEMLGFYSIAEVVDDSNKSPNKTIFCYLGEGFSKHQLKSLQATAKLVEANGTKVFTSLEEIAEYLNSQQNKQELNKVSTSNETNQAVSHETIELVNREEQLETEEQGTILTTITQQQLLPEVNQRRTLIGFNIPLWLVRIFCCRK